MLIRVLVLVWVINFIAWVGMGDPKTKVPDTFHTFKCHVRGVGDYYCSPLEGVYREYIAPGIFIAGMLSGAILGVIARARQR